MLEDDDELQFGEDRIGEKTKTGSASEQVTVRLDFPGNDYVREPRAIGKSKSKICLLRYYKNPGVRFTKF